VALPTPQNGLCPFEVGELDDEEFFKQTAQKKLIFSKIGKNSEKLKFYVT